MIYLIYAILATTVVLLSNKAAKYVDLIDKTTNLSGAFIGGVLLSAVTSLPELLTSISATVWLDNPSLSLGNILGSNIFNLSILSILILWGLKAFKKSNISQSHTNTTLFTLIIYIVVILNMFNIFKFTILTISFTSILIFILYILGVKAMASSGNDELLENLEESAVTMDLTLKQIIFRFIITSIGLVISSIFITYATDIISVKLNLGTGLAGALFLGIATSLPEVTSCISLVKIKNYNVAVGNVVGSNLFNFVILFIADVLYLGEGIYNFSEPQTKNLLLFGAIATILTIIILKFKNKFKNNLLIITASLGIITSYLLFLIL